MICYDLLRIHLVRVPSGVHTDCGALLRTRECWTYGQEQREITRCGR